MKNAVKLRADNNSLTEKAFLIMAVVSHIAVFVVNLIVGGLQIDETMTSLNAYALAENGTDILGNKLPVYFCTWIRGGQSPVATYLSAISVKIFGESLFAVRLPMLLTSLVGIFAFNYFAKRVFGNSKYATVLIGLWSVSPWVIFTSGYVLDCNYLTYNLLFAFCFLPDAIEKGSAKHYVLSMLFFALGFYSYIASVLIIPITLVVMYLCLIIKKKISLTNVFISVLSLILFSAAFILFGLVSVGVLDDFALFGFTLGGMDNYSRASDLTFAPLEMLWNLVGSLLALSAVDYMYTCYGQNLFQFGNLLAGVFCIIGVIFLAKQCFKRSPKLTFLQKLFSLGFFVGIVFFCSTVKNPNLDLFYRYGVLTLNLIFIEGIGITAVAELMKKLDFRKVVTGYVLTSLLVTSVAFGGLYIPGLQKPTFCSYADSYIECLDYIDSRHGEKIVTLTNYFQGRVSVFARYHYGNDKFVNFRDESKDITAHNPIVKSNERLSTTRDYDKSTRLDGDFYIAEKNELENINTEGYYIVDKGEFVVLERNSS